MPDLPRLIIATRNSHKTDEIRDILGETFDVCGVTSFPDLPEIEETGTTFLENARLKALGISRCIDDLVLADDSGLEVDALDGAPGVWSSSYGGEEGNHAKNNQRLIAEMTGKQPRTARFRCTLVLAQNGEEIANYHGTVEGEIATSPSGSGGFGYDPLFVPEGYNQTLADLGKSVKNQLSHRAKAIQSFVLSVTSGKLIK
jgi:XTP/dITP diphosphohydrolase